MNPTTGIEYCSARAASGHTVAAEPAIMKSRRLIGAPEAWDSKSYWFRRGSLRDDPMSALGQKRTCALQQAMSVLPPIATSIASSDARRVVQVRAIKGVAENQKSESARGDTGCR